jgi:Activator of Hsp90 ATPase homolog 1-like protein
MPASQSFESKVEDAPDNEIIISRVLNAPRELVWQAMTDPEHVAQWWGPNGFTTIIEKMELRVGGVWKHVIIGPDDQTYHSFRVRQCRRLQTRDRPIWCARRRSADVGPVGGVSCQPPATVTRQVG